MKGRTIALAGNPNVGKSALFHALTGAYAEVSNYPGTTLELISAPLGNDVLVDTPGAFGLSAFNDEERVARDILLHANLVIDVIAAPFLERDLFYTLQLADLGMPLVVALNQVDEARRRGLRVDHAALAVALGVPVVEVVAVEGWGVGELRQALQAARPALLGPQAGDVTALADAEKIPFREALLILEGDVELARRRRVPPRDLRAGAYRERASRAARLAESVVSTAAEGRDWGRVLGRAILRPIWGYPTLLAVLAGLYLFLGWLVGQQVVDFLDARFFSRWYIPLVRRMSLRYLHPQGMMAAMLVGPHGLLTATVMYLLGLVLPLVFAFYLALAFLEDIGYLPRLAALLDRSFAAVGLNGKAVIPFVLGLGCVTMATLSTRLLGTRRERTIAVALLALAVPCSAQAAVIMGILTPLGPRYLAMYALVLLGVFLTAGLLLRQLVPGSTSPLLLDLPPLRWPSPMNLWRKAVYRSWAFLREAAPYFCYGNLALAVLATYGGLGKLEGALQPVTQGFLKLPAGAAQGFLLGMLRRDLGAAGLMGIGMSPDQTLVAALSITLFLPCLPSLLMIFKERGLREGVSIWLGTLAAAMLIGRTAGFFLGL